MTITQALKAITNYPIPSGVISLACVVGGIEPTETVDAETLQSLGYLRAEKHVIGFLLTAPTSISEQGVSYSVGSDEKSELRKRLSDLNSAIGAAELAEGETPKPERPNVAFDAF